MNHHGYSLERLIHYKCRNCGGWWSIGDGPADRKLYCPWCGMLLPTEKLEDE